MNDPSHYVNCVDVVDGGDTDATILEDPNLDPNEACFADLETLPQFRMPIVAPKLIGMQYE
jgi:hypothetical protein